MMKSKQVLSIVVLAALTMMALAVPAFAQDTPPEAAETVSYTLTEEQINEAFRLNNPRRIRITAQSVDLQPNQVLVFTSYEFRGGKTLDTITTMVPSVIDGRLYWDVTSMETGGGAEASPQLLAQINTRIDTAWRNYLRGQVSGRIIDASITDIDITITAELPVNRFND